MTALFKNVSYDAALFEEGRTPRPEQPGPLSPEPEEPEPQPPQPEIPPGGPEEPHLPSPDPEPLPSPVPGPTDPAVPRPILQYDWSVIGGGRAIRVARLNLDRRTRLDGRTRPS